MMISQLQTTDLSAPLAEDLQGLDVSLVVPLYNEQENVQPLYEAIVDALDGSYYGYEVIFVDDGSRDATPALLNELVAKDKRLRVIQLRTNFGQTAAMRAGVDMARGRVIVTIDGDLQNDPRDIPLLVKQIDQGADLVSGWRRDRKDRLISRRLPSAAANWLIAQATSVPIHDTGCSLKAYRSDLIKRIPLYSDMHRFIPAMSTLTSARIEEIPVRHHARKFGASKYGLSRTGKVTFDLVTVKMLLSSSQRPLHWFGGWAVISFFFSLAAGVWWVWAALRGNGEDATFVLPSVVLLLGYLGIHLLFAGVFADLIVRAGRSGPPKPLSTITRLR